jgi:hypothetical protein
MAGDGTVKQNTDIRQDFHDHLVAPDVTGVPDRFFDRFMFNAHPADATAPSIVMGLGIYPPKNVVDGFVVVVTGTEQRNLRFSTELSATDGTSAGPMSWQTVEPNKTWAVQLGPNESGVELDLVWHARTPAWSGEVGVAAEGEVTATFDHLFQSGRYEGTVTIDGETFDATGWYGQRDRSRGVRTMKGGQGLHIWYQAQFPDRSVGFLLVENRQGGRLLLEGAVMHEDGTLDDITDVAHDLSFDDQLDLRSGTVRVRTASGQTYDIAADASAGGGYMAGGGYGDHHGKQLGRDHVEYDVYPLDGSVTPKTLDSALTDRLASFDWEGTAGVGIFEFAHTRSASYVYKPTLRR